MNKDDIKRNALAKCGHENWLTLPSSNESETDKNLKKAMFLLNGKGKSKVTPVF
jgi:hypothetical protein